MKKKKESFLSVKVKIAKLIKDCRFVCKRLSPFPHPCPFILSSRSGSVTQACQSASPASQTSNGVRHGHVTLKLRLKKPSFPVGIANWKDNTSWRCWGGVKVESKQKSRKREETVYLRSSIQSFLISPCSSQLQEWLNPPPPPATHTT